MTDSGQTSPGQRMYGTAGTTPGGYHPTGGGPTAVNYNGIGDPQGPGMYRQPGPPVDFQVGQFFPAPGSQRAGVGGYGPKSTGMVGRAGWSGIRYGGSPQTTPLNQLLHGSTPDGWVTADYGQTARTMVESGGGSQPGWSQQQLQQQHLTPPGGSSPYSNRQQAPSLNAQVRTPATFDHHPRTTAQPSYNVYDVM